MRETGLLAPDVLIIAAPRILTRRMRKSARMRQRRASEAAWRSYRNLWVELGLLPALP